MKQALINLISELPRTGSAASPEANMRGSLRPILELAVDSSPTTPPIEADPAACPNCNTPVASTKSPFCSPQCREIVAFVRQFRASVANGLILDPERQLALGQKLCALQGFGYPYRQTLIPAKTIAKVIERDGGTCSICGAPATEVDHTGSG